jgi:hypothetical protein
MESLLSHCAQISLTNLTFKTEETKQHHQNNYYQNGNNKEWNGDHSSPIVLLIEYTLKLSKFLIIYRNLIYNGLRRAEAFRIDLLLAHYWVWGSRMVSSYDYCYKNKHAMMRTRKNRQDFDSAKMIGSICSCYSFVSMRMDVQVLRLSKCSSKFPFFSNMTLLSRVIGYFRQEFFIVFKFWLVGVALSVVVSVF